MKARSGGIGYDMQQVAWYNKPYLDMKKAERQLMRVSNKLDHWRIQLIYGKNRVPTLVVDDYYSVVYFGKIRAFQVATNFRVYDKKPKKYKLRVINDVVEFLTKNNAYLEDSSSQKSTKCAIV